MIFDNKTRTQSITKESVWHAWKHVSRGKQGSSGIDGLSIETIKAQSRKYLYPLWNRLSSGSYMPSAVKEVGIPKTGGGTRLLGIPTVCDRVAQQVIREELEAIVEPLFHPSSFGYRPNKSAFDAIAQCEKHCWARWYVVDIDIKGFFDNIDHDEMMKILRKYTDKKHILLYCSRWLSAPIRKEGALELTQRTKGTPQGGVISPLLANLFLHEVFDTWMQANHSIMVFERYCDDIVIHTRSISQSNFILDKVKERFAQYKLCLNADKTKTVYCYRTARFHKETKDIPCSFDFLGYTFKPLKCKKENGELFGGFGAVISLKSQSKILQAIRAMHIPQCTKLSITELAIFLRQKVSGWIQYYGKFRLKSMARVFWTANHRIIRFLQNKYKESSYRRAKRRYQWLVKHYPNLFTHWQYGFTNVKNGSVTKSRMTGDCHVRFCKRLGVKLPRPTQLVSI
jgi:group II intron reverse transcriptase/maturase